MSEKNNNPSFLLGIAIGAGLAYLFTAKNGQRIRGQLIKEGTKLLDKIGENLEEAQETAQEIKDQIEEKALSTKEDLEEKKDEVVKKAKDTAEQVQENIEELKTEVEEISAQIPQEVREIQKKGRRFFFHRHHNHES